MKPRLRALRALRPGARRSALARPGSIRRGRPALPVRSSEHQQGGALPQDRTAQRGVRRYSVTQEKMGSSRRSPAAGSYTSTHRLALHHLLTRGRPSTEHIEPRRVALPFRFNFFRTLHGTPPQSASERGASGLARTLGRPLTHRASPGRPLRLPADAPHRRPPTRRGTADPSVSALLKRPTASPEVKRVPPMRTVSNTTPRTPRDAQRYRVATCGLFPGRRLGKRFAASVSVSRLSQFTSIMVLRAYRATP